MANFPKIFIHTVPVLAKVVISKFSDFFKLIKTKYISNC